MSCAAEREGLDAEDAVGHAVEPEITLDAGVEEAGVATNGGGDVLDDDGHLVEDNRDLAGPVECRPEAEAGGAGEGGGVLAHAGAADGGGAVADPPPAVPRHLHEALHALAAMDGAG